VTFMDRAKAASIMSTCDKVRPARFSSQ